MTEEDRKRGSSGTIRQTCPGHVARVRLRGETAAPSAKGSQEHLGASRGIRKPLETATTPELEPEMGSSRILSSWETHHTLRDLLPKLQPRRKMHPEYR